MVRPVSPAAESNLSFRFPRWNQNLKYQRNSVVSYDADLSDVSSSIEIYIARQDVDPREDSPNSNSKWIALFTVPENAIVDSDGNIITVADVQFETDNNRLLVTKTGGQIDSYRIPNTGDLRFVWDSDTETLTIRETFLDFNTNSIVDSEITSFSFKDNLSQSRFQEIEAEGRRDKKALEDFDSDFFATWVPAIQDNADEIEYQKLRVDSEFAVLDERIVRLVETDSDVQAAIQGTIDSDFLAGAVENANGTLINRVTDLESRVDSDETLIQQLRTDVDNISIDTGSLDSDVATRISVESIDRANADSDLQAQINAILLEGDSDFTRIEALETRATDLDSDQIVQNERLSALESKTDADSDALVALNETVLDVDSDRVVNRQELLAKLDSEETARKVQVANTDSDLRVHIEQRIFTAQFNTIDSEFLEDRIRAAQQNAPDSDFVLRVAADAGKVDSEFVLESILVNRIDSEWVRRQIDLNTDFQFDSDWIVRQITEQSVDSDYVDRLTPRNVDPETSFESQRYAPTPWGAGLYTTLTVQAPIIGNFNITKDGSSQAVVRRRYYWPNGETTDYFIHFDSDGQGVSLDSEPNNYLDKRFYS